MAFHIKKREEFLDSLKNIKTNPSSEENLIENFTSDKLSDLYKLFLSLKDIPLSTAQFKSITNIISSNYEQKISLLLHNPITDNEISALLEIMQQEYYEIVKSGNPKNISIKEQNQLKEIINQHYSNMFLDFIETPIAAEEFSKQTDLIKDAITSLVNQYYQQTTPHAQRNSDYLGSAIYLVYRKLYPELSTSVFKREKGFKSFTDNIHKELNKNIKNIIPSDEKTGITLSDMEKHILSNSENPNNFTDKTNDDISGITVVLNHVEGTIYFDENDPENIEVLKLKKQKDDNLRFMHSVKKYLNENDIFMTQEEYYQIYIELLYRLQNTTYPECTHEIKEGSYSSRLEYAISTYKKKLETNSFATNARDDEIDELYSLTNCLQRRLYDKFENEILRISFPHVLSDPLFTEVFKIKANFIKFVKKENGFCAIYFELIDDLGRKTEVQLQSIMRYKETKNGLSTHNDMPSKKIDIKPFFELVNNEYNPELLDHYLSLLARTSKEQEETLSQRLKASMEQLSSPNITPERERSLKNSIRRLQIKLNTIKTAKRSIKIKDEFVEEYDMINAKDTKQEDNYEIHYIDGKPIKVYNTKTDKRISKISIEQYLLTFAEYLSPTTMKVISSAHATAPEALVNKKDLVENFTEILRTGDEITYLSELLIDKLKEILSIKDKSQISFEELRKYAENDFYAPEEDFFSPNDTHDDMEL